MLVENTYSNKLDDSHCHAAMKQDIAVELGHMVEERQVLLLKKNSPIERSNRKLLQVHNLVDNRSLTLYTHMLYMHTHTHACTHTILIQHTDRQTLSYLHHGTSSQFKH